MTSKKCATNIMTIIRPYQLKTTANDITKNGKVARNVKCITVSNIQ